VPRLPDLDARPFGATDKGFGLLAGKTAADLRGSPLHEAGLTYPVLTLRGAALEHNAAAMAAYCAAAGAWLAPHGKTHMSPELAALQLRHGAWAITVATPWQAAMYRSFGVKRLLIANEITDPADIAWVSAQPGMYSYCDSPAGVDLLVRTIRATSGAHPLPVLVEVGHADGRTGTRTDEAALAVAHAVSAAPDALRLAGVAAFEGGLRSVDEVAVFMRRMASVARTLRPLASGEFLVSAGGSAYFDVVASELSAVDGAQVVLRSGCYLTHDYGWYQKVTPSARGVAGAPEFRQAIELWARVLSRPEDGLALLNFGRRDAGWDAGYPVVLRAAGLSGAPSTVAVTEDWRVVQLNDQHAYLQLPTASSLSPGDLVCLGISHPCTTLDKWRVLPVADDAGIITDVVHSFF
jgi:D-serine deaminase-like pyridoxal phosphate-dependent protein